MTLAGRPEPCEEGGQERCLGRLDAIPDGGAKGFPAAPGGFTGLVAVRRGAVLRVYVNACPHVGLPLDLLPDHFLDSKGEKIVCSAHGARFRIEDGLCVTGPCLGERLEPVPVQLDAEGGIWVPAGAGA